VWGGGGGGAIDQSIDRMGVVIKPLMMLMRDGQQYQILTNYSHSSSLVYHRKKKIKKYIYIYMCMCACGVRH